MKTRTFKTTILAATFVLSLIVSVKIIRSDYKTLRSDFLMHSKGKTQRFINSFIN